MPKKNSFIRLLITWFIFVNCFFVLSPERTYAVTTFHCTSSGGCNDISVPDWVYQNQGNGDLSAANNCGPASVVMAVRYASNQYSTLRPETVRPYGGMGTQRNTTLAELKTALLSYKVTSNEITSFSELEKAITERNHIVIALVNMGAISTLSGDYQQVNQTGSYKCPVPGHCSGEIEPFSSDVYRGYSYWVWNQNRPSDVESGRYNQYKGNHWLILKGEVWHFGPRFIAFDPNVFAGNLKYYYSDGSPKGRNRSYSGEDILNGFLGQAIEITGYNPSLSPSLELPVDDLPLSNTDTDTKNLASLSDNAQFLSHVNYGSGATFLPGQGVVKIWHIKNSGSTDYGYEYGVEQVSGNSVEVYGPSKLSNVVSSGAEANVSVSLTAPTQPGTYNTYWQMVDAFGNKFGDVLAFSFTVGSSGSDTIPPSGSFTSPSNGSTINTRAVNISANASDNSGGSGVREVRFKARWSGGDWVEIGADSSSPYSVQWDMCNFQVPQGSLELDLDIYDFSGNKYTFSSTNLPLSIIKNYDCSGSGLPSADQWHAEAWMNKYMAGYVNKSEYWPAGVSNITYPFIGYEKDWGTGAPYSGFPSDEFSFKIYGDMHFNGGHYFFRVCSDDGVRLLVDNQTKINEWWDRGGCLETDHWLSPGYHPVEVQYYENTGNAYIKLYMWGEEYPRPELDEPDGRITSPTNNSYVNQIPLTIWADAWDDKSGVDRVKLKMYHCVGGCQWRELETDYSAPYRFENWDWSSLEGQQIKLAIDVTDKSGRNRGNAGGEITVTLDKTPPIIWFTSPTNGAADTDKLVALNMSVSDNVSGVASVKFFAGYEDGTNNYWHEIGTDTNGTDGWGLSWNASSIQDGKLVDFYTTAYDHAGNMGNAVVYGIMLGDPWKYLYLPAILNRAGAEVPNPDPCMSWNLVNDFRLSPNQENPGRDSCGRAGVWSYMVSANAQHNPATYTSLNEFIPDAYDISGLQQWQGTIVGTSNKDKLPSLGINKTGTTQSPQVGMKGIVWPSNVFRIHPWYPNMAVIGWKSPISGQIQITGGVEGIDRANPCSDGILWYIDKGSSTIAHGSIGYLGKQDFNEGTGGSLLSRVEIMKDQQIFFLFHANTNPSCDSVKLDITINLINQ